MANKKLTVRAADFSLLSKWKCVVDTSTAGRYGYRTYKFSSGPTLGAKNVSFAYSLPSGAKIISAKIHAKVSSLYTGYSSLNVSGNTLKASGSERVASVTLSGTSGTYVGQFHFRANGNKQDTDEHTSRANFTNVYLEIEYNDDAAQQQTQETKKVSTSSSSSGFHIPPQKVAIYNQDTGKIYLFDGVEKIQHAFSLKIEEEPSKNDKEHKDQYVNNALNEPDKVTLDVIMSDVYTDIGALNVASGWDETMQQTAYNASKSSLMAQENGVWSRSENAARILRKLKTDRVLVSVITPQYVHSDMLIQTVTINQDSETPYGWTGQIGFQHKPIAKQKKSNAKTAQATGTTVGTSSNLFTAFGEVVSV